MKRFLCILPLLALQPAAALAQRIAVDPKGVNVNAHGVTTVFLTFGGLGERQPAEAVWCGTLVPATPDIGLKCDPGTIFGTLPARHDFSVLGGAGRFTDIMSIPPSVARRAYQSAQRDADPRFFYVRRFVNPAGGPDEYVDVTCRLTAGGARTPLALTDVRLAFADAAPILFVRPAEALPPLHAEIRYNGTGRLRGRWEVVLPGEELPELRDLLTEATLPPEERARQRRYTELARFNVFLPPTGRAVLPGPEPARLPSHLEGMYLVLLRIEASDDRDGDSDLAAVGAGDGVLHSGGVAGFPLPTLRYVVGGGESRPATAPGVHSLALLLPLEDAQLGPDLPVMFSWSDGGEGTLVRLEVEDAQGRRVLAAVLPAGIGVYRAPPWLRDRPGTGPLRWRVLALARDGSVAGQTPWRTLALSASPGPFR